jgi:hypothetical protein
MITITEPMQAKGIAAFNHSFVRVSMTATLSCRGTLLLTVISNTMRPKNEQVAKILSANSGVTVVVEYPRKTKHDKSSIFLRGS